MSTFIDTNRVTVAIERFEAVLAAEANEAQLAKLEEIATLDHESWFAFGEFPVRAHMAGLITLGESLTLHAIHTDFRTTATLAQRMVFMQMMTEFVGKC